MPNLKKLPKDKTSVKLAVTLTPPVAKRVGELAAKEQRTVAAMLRLLIERALDEQPAGAK